MSEQVRIRRANGQPDIIGIPVSEGPLTYRVLVTDPYQRQGRIVEVPHDEIDSVEDVELGAAE
jgi:hypothetical protein